VETPSQGDRGERLFRCWGIHKAESPVLKTAGRIGRVFGAALAIEAMAILLLVVMVAAFGPKDPAAAQAYAERMGQWVGPIGGAGLCFWAVGG
jgi:hypothetical protein